MPFTTRTANRIHLYLLAGVATDPLFMDGFRLALEERLRQAGWTVRSRLLYPYGDWSRRLIGQLREIRHDLWPLRDRPLRSIGGLLAAGAVRSDATTGALPLLIGHSGGGTAAVHALRILAEDRAFAGTAPPPRVIQIGSPRCPVPRWLSSCALYAEAVNIRGKSSDPVTRLGSWGGWRRGPLGLPVWQPALAAPGSIVRLPLIGGHADYFRESPSFVNADGLSNLEVTLQAVYEWFESTFETEAAPS